MAILLRGKTTCPLCCRVIADGEPARGFPAFLKATHRLGMFSDASFHESCLEASKEASEAQQLYEKWQSIWDNRPLDLKSLVEIEAWGKAAFAEFIAETERIDTAKSPTPVSPPSTPRG